MAEAAVGCADGDIPDAGAAAPTARSMLMDRATLLGHRDQWATEPSPTAAALDRLDRAESALYADLISNAYAPSVRLEQERVSFSAVEKAVADC